MSDAQRPPIYPVRRVVEHTWLIDGARPLRFFALLLPLRRIEIAAHVAEAQPYELLDRFVERAIADGRIDTAEAVADFFGLNRGLVAKVVDFLRLIGHIGPGEPLTLTELGLRSVREKVRYVAKESRQYLLFDRFTLSPLPRTHYGGGVRLLSTPTVGRTYDGTQFQTLWTNRPFEYDVVRRLAERPDRDEFNLPSDLRDIRIVRDDDAYLPIYVVETVGGTRYLGFSTISGERDMFVERLCNTEIPIQRALRAERTEEPRRLWLDWLAKRGYDGSYLRQLPNELWRVTLPAAAFSGDNPTVRTTKVGSFEVQGRYFAQMWCTDADLRRRAALDRVLQLLGSLATRAELRTQLELLARQLELPALTESAVRAHAERSGRPDRVALLDALGG